MLETNALALSVGLTIELRVLVAGRATEDAEAILAELIRLAILSQTYIRLFLAEGIAALAHVQVDRDIPSRYWYGLDDATALRLRAPLLLFQCTVLIHVALWG